MSKNELSATQKQHLLEAIDLGRIDILVDQLNSLKGSYAVLFILEIIRKDFDVESRQLALLNGAMKSEMGVR